ncbi:MAG: DUF2339 domain-containing protein [Planctomycetaceae bacterium]|nr:DUF2339 domain-containing protein [Planctomycetaceae bacterium]
MDLFTLLGLLLGLFYVVGLPIAIFWLFHMQEQIRELLQQNERIETALWQIQPPPNAASPVIPPVSPPVKRDDDHTVDHAEQGATAHIVAPVSHIVPVNPPVMSEWDDEQAVRNAANPNSSLELFIGQKLFGWIAVAGFIVAAALLIRYAVNMGWITDILKVAGIALFGAGLLAIGYYSRRTGLRRFSTMMSSAGIILLYQAGYASYAFYSLISLTAASILMPLIVFGGFLLAWLYRSKLLGTVAILGGLAVPLLISSSDDRHVELFLYLMSLNIGTLLLVNLLRRAPIAWLAFFGTQALFWIWYGEQFQLQHLIAVLLFQSAFYLVFLADTAIAALRPIGEKYRPTWDDAMRAVLAPIIFFGTLYIVLINRIAELQLYRVIEKTAGSSQFRVFVEPPHAIDTTYVFLYNHLGYIAFFGAFWYALLAVLYGRHLVKIGFQQQTGGTVGETDVNRPVFWIAAPSAAVVIALGFVAIAIPLQFSAMWITLGWLTVFAGLWVFGHRQENKTFIVMSYVFFTLGIVRLVMEIGGQVIGEQAHTLPVLNNATLPMLASAAMLMIAVAVLTFLESRSSVHGSDHRSDRHSVNNAVLGLLGNLLFLAILTIEWYQYFEPLASATAAFRSVTILWSLYALLWIALGFAIRSMPIRIAGLIVLFGALVKTTANDSWMSIGFCSWKWGADYSLADWTLLANPYFLTMLCPVLPTLLLAVGMNRGKTVNNERIAWKVAGIIGLVALLIYLSVECYQFFDALQTEYSIIALPFFGSAALTILWTAAAAILAFLALHFRSKVLRIVAMSVLCLAVLKVVLDLEIRPEYAVPFWNPYALPMLLLAATVLALGYFWACRLGEEDRAERNVYRVFAFLGIVFLWYMMSVESFRTVQLQRAADVSPLVAQMALSILWSLFAGVLIAIGFVWRSATLRWMAILLFAVTLLKILVLDMSGVNELYRFGAVFALASLLMLATWAYQRFKPE